MSYDIYIVYVGYDRIVDRSSFSYIAVLALLAILNRLLQQTIKAIA